MHKLAARISPRQRQILKFVAAGLTSPEIAKRIERSEKTVEVHRSHIHRTLRTNTTVQMIREAMRIGLLTKEDLTAGDPDKLSQ